MGTYVIDFFLSTDVCECVASNLSNLPSPTEPLQTARCISRLFCWPPAPSPRVSLSGSAVRLRGVAPSGAAARPCAVRSVVLESSARLTRRPSVLPPSLSPSRSPRLLDGRELNLARQSLRCGCHQSRCRFPHRRPRRPRRPRSRPPPRRRPRPPRRGPPSSRRKRVGPSAPSSSP